MRPLVQDKQQTLNEDVEPGLPLIMGDEDKLAQVLTNFVSNAHKYNNPGGWIRIEAKREGDFARVAVVDNGFGISEEDQKKLFQRFFRVENSLTRNIGGTGLGLNITKAIVELHGGQVRVESELGKGSSFGFTVPLVKELPAPAEMESAEPLPAALVVEQPEPVAPAANGESMPLPVAAPAEPKPPQPKQILVVEDDHDVAQLIESHLAQAGYAVQVVHSAEAALTAIQTHRPDLVTLDIGLPGMDGFALAEQLAMNDETTDLPILVISVYNDDPRLKQFGVKTVPKPLNREQLLGTVAELLGAERRQVLVVDDDPSVGELLRASLGKDGFDVLVARDGPTAVQLAQQQRPGLILLDLLMPGMDGFAVLQALKQNPETATIPVVAMTGNEDYKLGARARLLALGAADLVAKPFDLDLLTQEVRLLIQTDE
jgi:CheY-like chemotaxis protein